jgi:hypothetical protein
VVRLPVPGGDDGNWGSILNSFLQVAHNNDGTLQQRAITAAGGYAKPVSGIPASDLDVSTQTIITSVASKYVKPGAGIPAADLTSSVQASLSSADNALQVGGDLGGTPASPSVTSTHLATALPIDQGGTGSITQSFVDLSTTQTVGGIKTFSVAPSAPALTTTGQGVLETAQSVAASGSAYSINLAAGTVVSLTLTAACTLTFPSVLYPGACAGLDRIEDGHLADWREVGGRRRPGLDHGRRSAGHLQLLQHRWRHDLAGLPGRK